MAANIYPFYPQYAANSAPAWVTLTTANTAMDGTGTVTTLFTAASADGHFIPYLIVRPLGTNVASVIRVFINNGADPTVATNNALITEIGTFATTASNTTPQNGIIHSMPPGFILPSGYKINLTLGTAVAAGLKVIAIQGAFS